MDFQLLKWAWRPSSFQLILFPIEIPLNKKICTSQKIWKIKKYREHRNEFTQNSGKSEMKKNPWWNLMKSTYYASASVLVVILNFSYRGCYHGRKFGEWYTRILFISSYNCIRIFNHLKIKFKIVTLDKMPIHSPLTLTKIPPKCVSVSTNISWNEKLELFYK